MRRFVRGLVREVAIAALLFLVVLVLVYRWVDSGDAIDPAQPTASATVAPVSTEPTVSMSPSPKLESPAPVETRVPKETLVPTCALNTGAFVPARLVIEQVGLDITLTALPLGAGDSLPVPISPKRSVNATTGAWWKDGAQPGGGQGVVAIGTHTFSAGYDAAGNKVLRVTQGAVAKLYDAAGTVRACYAFDRRLDVLPADPLPRDVWRLYGPPGLEVVACDDFDPKSKTYDVRAYHVWTQIK